MYLLLVTGGSNTSFQQSHSHTKRMEMTRIALVQKSSEHTKLNKGNNFKTSGQISSRLLRAGVSGTSFAERFLDVFHEDGERSEKQALSPPQSTEQFSSGRTQY